METHCDDGQLEEKWLRLRAAIRMALRPNIDLSRVQFMPLYDLVYQLTSEPRAPVLYLRLRSQLYTHARTCARIISSRANIHSLHGQPPDVDEDAEEMLRLIDAVGNGNGTALEVYAALWTAYKRGMESIAAIFYYLDVHWVKKNRKKSLDVAEPSWKTVPVFHVAELGLLAWRDEMVFKVVPKLLEITHAIICSMRRKMVAASKFKVEVGPPYQSPSMRHIRVLLLSLVQVGDTALFRILDGDAESFDSHPAHLSNSSNSNNSSNSWRSCTSAAYPSVTQPHKPLDILRKTPVVKERIALDIYRSLWERTFLAKAAQFYATQADAVLKSKDAKINDYVGNVANAGLEDEITFALNFSHPSTILPLRRVLQGELVSKQKRRLIAEADRLIYAAARSQSFQVFQEDNQVHDLKQLFNTLKCVPDAADILSDALRRHAIEAGNLAVKQITIECGVLASGNSAEWKVIPIEKQSPPALFVCRAWAVYARLQAVVEDAFYSNVAFQRALNQACESFVNSVDSAPALLAHFIHELLEENSARNATIDGLEIDSSSPCPAHLDGVAVDEWAIRATRLFRFLSDKQAFQRAYARKLAHRLVFNTSRSRVAELNVLDLLAALCGTEYTSRLKRMFGDIDSSVQLTREYTGGLEKQAQFHLNVLVLSSGAWPSDEKAFENTAMNGGANSNSGSAAQTAALRARIRAERSEREAAAFLALPNRIGAACTEFSQYYTANRPKRKLTWAYSQCRVWLSGRIERTGGDTVLLETTISQAAILLHIDSQKGRSTCTTQALASSLGLVPELVNGAVRALVRAGVLINTEGGVEVEIAEKLRTKRRMDGEYAVVRVALVTTDADVTAQESEAKKRARGAREGDRRTQIAAVMVRIMKSERSMKEDELFKRAEKSLAAWFTPTVADLNRSADNLVENEYLALDAGVYRYVI